MAGPDKERAQGEIERLRQALDAAARECLELQRRLDGADAKFEEFVSMAAHNLREPLRDVASISQLIAETNAGRLDSEAATFLARIRKEAAGMQALLADVVDYWATATGGRPPSRTDMEAVCCQALLATEKQVTARGAIVTHDHLPETCGDFETLTKVFHHLIRNAIEYCDAPFPRVHISSRRQGRDWLFSVKDNGPGIDAAFQGRIFEVFKRLHGQEHPGNGLGLAFCKKAIEWQGGRIWVESNPAEGSTFYFTLPPAE